MLEARALVAAAIGVPEVTLTGCLCNNYPAGAGSISWHHDEVRAHGKACIIATLSLGSTREFRLRKKASHPSVLAARSSVPAGPSSNAATSSVDEILLCASIERVESVLLASGDILLMSGFTQDFYEHELPLRAGDGHRISLTFRSIERGYEQQRALGPLDLCGGQLPGDSPLTAPLRGWRIRASRAFPWPSSLPAVPPRMHGWLHVGNERLLLRLLRDYKPRIVAELGCWLGLTTRLLATNAKGASIFALDRSLG